MKTPAEKENHGPAGRVAGLFINSKLTPLVIVASILLGLAAVLLLPREEEPQIKVPMVDVMVSFPGATAREVEQQATTPMEKLLWEIPGVDYIYSTSRPGEALVIVRFKVGEEIERSLVKLNQKLQSNFDRIPPGVSIPLIKPRSIDDVPIMALTFHSARHDHLALRRIALEVETAVKQVPQVAETTLIGGARRQLRVTLDPARLASRALAILDVERALAGANVKLPAGALTRGNGEVRLEAGGLLESVEQVKALVIGVQDRAPIYLRDVAEVSDSAEELTQYVLFGLGAAGGGRPGEEAAVTLALAKRPGANAIRVAQAVEQKLEALRSTLLPRDVTVTVTRNYGETAAEKSDELLWHMAIAVASVSLLILFILGWRESVIVAVAIPSTLALTLLVFYIYGFTLNRITLFALIFSIGILVDDAIVVVENIVRHFNLPENSSRTWAQIATRAVNEVGNPTILATFAVIFAVLPMGFVGGLMEPYMRPIPIGASAAMFFSLLIAFVVTPWAAVRVLRWANGEARLKAHHGAGAGAAEEDFLTRLYRRVMGAFIRRPVARWSFLLGIVALLLGAMLLVGIGWVKVKMLPFDNKSEFQVILNMPEGSSLEQTARAAREIAAAVRTEPEVLDYEIYAGVAAPFNFNGLVRHYFLRGGAASADIQVNLVNKSRRKAQSHDIAKRVRPGVAAIAARYGARVAVAEVPPGPPVLQTLVAEIYGPTEEARIQLFQEARKIFQETKGVVDVDWYLEADQPRVEFVVDQERAALHGISAASIALALKAAVAGEAGQLLHLPREREPVSILLRFDRPARSSVEDLLNIYLPGASPAGAAEKTLTPLRELVSVKHSVVDKAIYHKNLMPVTYLLGDVAGEVESPAYAIFRMNEKLRKLDLRKQTGGSEAHLQIYNAAQPFADLQPALKWDGEWHITLEVFRDMGLAFAAVLVLIYILMVGWFGSFLTPLVVMVAIPFSLVGILPAHGALGAFFTATSMIGFMAGAGIVVRNSIILVDFIEQRVAEGMALDEAIIDAGAVRFRPMVLTALAVVAGAAIILFDPIFQGLAISLMAGEVASLLISRMAVPILYWLAKTSPAGSAGPSPAAQ